MRDFEKTQFINLNVEKTEEIGEILKNVYVALNEKGYDSINQIVGYILSGDPTYITNYKNARKDITKIDVDELINFLLKSFLNDVK